MNYHRFSEHVEDLKVEVRLFSDIFVSRENEQKLNK